MAMGSNMTVADSNFDETTALNLAEIFRALSDPSRLRILSILFEQD
jgi:DNA-binding transcriptional ArsR family regulator